MDQSIDQCHTWHIPTRNFWLHCTLLIFSLAYNQLESELLFCPHIYSTELEIVMAQTRWIKSWLKINTRESLIWIHKVQCDQIFADFYRKFFRYLPKFYRKKIIINHKKQVGAGMTLILKGKLRLFLVLLFCVACLPDS